MIDFIALFGGVGLFLFGMNLMGTSLKKLAGAKLESILQKLTTSKKKGIGELKGWGIGLGVTGIIQSSAASRYTFFENAVNRGDIANLHLGFNSMILLPFSNNMAALTKVLIKDKND